jgi:hypothetical protein
VNYLPEGTLGKGLALAICLGLAAIVYMATVAPMIALYIDNRQSLQERLDVMQRLGNSTRDLPRLRAAAQGQGVATGNPLFEATSDTVTAASIQSTVKSIIEASDGKLTSSEMLASDQPDDRYRRIRIRVAFEGTLTLLASVLRGIETSSPALVVDNVDVRAAATDDDDSEPKLAIAFDVCGFRSL